MTSEIGVELYNWSGFPATNGLNTASNGDLRILVRGLKSVLRYEKSLGARIERGTS